MYPLKADFFRVPGHPAWVRILQLLRDGERSVGALQEMLELDSSAISQHLAVLRRQRLVASRKQGTSVYNHVSDPRTLELLELAKAIISLTLEQNRTLLDDLALEDFSPRRDQMQS